MRNFLVLALLLASISAAPALWAQGDRAKLELFGGYSYVGFKVNANVQGQPPSQTFNGNGGGGQLVYNVDNRLGVLGEVAGYWATNSTRQGAAIPFLFGPRINLRNGMLRPFAQLLLGGVVTSSGIEEVGWQSHFAMAVGGGIDVRASKHFLIRPLQAEYLMTKIPDGLNNRQDNFRFGAGIVFRFG